MNIRRFFIKYEFPCIVVGLFIFLIAIPILFSYVEASEGVFIELDAGVFAVDYPSQNDCYEHHANCLSNDNPIGSLKIGYEYEWAHAYYQHISSIGSGDDSGLDLLMIGVKFQYGVFN